MTTYMQTTEVKMNGSALVLHNIERRPILPPAAVDGQQFIGSNVTYTVLADAIDAVYSDGTWKRWWNKPTMQMALDRPCAGDVYKFNSDGSAEVRMNGATYYWGVPFASSAENVYDLSTNFANLSTLETSGGYSYFGVH